MTEIFNEIGKIAEDLVNVEVNLILKSDISAQKMPKPRHAFFDIGKEYYGKLEEFGCLNKKLYIEDEGAKERLKSLKELVNLDNRLGSCDAFSYIRELANYKIKKNRVVIEEMEAAGPLNDEQKAHREKLETEASMLYRIKDNSDQIKGIFNTKCREYLTQSGDQKKDQEKLLESTAMCNMIDDDEPRKKFLTNLLTRAEIEYYQNDPLTLNPNQLTLLRKIWEVGTAEIAMQTVVQLDGDVVTRIMNKYANEDYVILHRLHDQGVTTAIGFWKDLVGLVKDFFENVIQFVAPTR